MHQENVTFSIQTKFLFLSFVVPVQVPDIQWYGLGI